MRAHGEDLRAEVHDEELVERIKRDYRTADLEGPTRALLDYASKLTRTPADIAESDIEALRSAGWDDTAILDACQMAAYFNYINRIADGLGIEIDS